ELACAEKDAKKYAQSKFAKLDAADLARLDADVAAIEAKNIRFDGWATPGENLHAAALDLARTAARRAERRLVALPAQGRSVRPLLKQWTNRVSDLLWLMAREAEQ
ncbi:MAG: ATP:cob(I)alamin adenosyltransferase, partial [Verrucomicrobiota bacterium]|nr:ATP:cob(I)alamin adenosyltransferase [Verrucomicrobiota bacterium]